MQYYDVVKNWRKIKPHLNDGELNNILVNNFNKFTYGRWKQEFKRGMYPRDFETCDWDVFRKGRKPEFFKYVKHAACHWLVNWNLRLAMLVEPDIEWRILTSNFHSTVWDGKETIFDCNFLAMGVDPMKAFEMANECDLGAGCYMVVYYADHFASQIQEPKLPGGIKNQITQLPEL